MASIVEQLTLQADRHPQKVLYGFLDIDGALTQSYTYAQFAQRVEDIALHLQRVAPSPAGSRVLLVYPPGVEMIAAFFACVRLGWIPVPVSVGCAFAASFGFRVRWSWRRWTT